MLGIIIKIIHVLLVIFILITPFTSSEYLQTLHLMIVPFILLHWLTNQSVCALTEMEKIVTGKTCDEETFFGQVVGPVYKFKTKGEENLFVWLLMITLWFITFVKLQTTNFAQFRNDIARVRRLIPI